MRNIRITLAYEGTAYSGFQRQENSITVQEILETALQKLTGTKTTLYFAARTDAGVHAYGQECTFYTESSIPGRSFHIRSEYSPSSRYPCNGKQRSAL